MKAFLRCLFLFFIGLGAVNAQEKVQDIIAIFQQTSSVDWSVPLPSSKERLSINWSERKVLITQKVIVALLAIMENILSELSHLIIIYLRESCSMEELLINNNNS